jgi:hypothetical protein
MKAWQERVVKEQSELSDKLENLKLFFGGGFKELKSIDQIDLYWQAACMAEYNRILERRIKRFKKEKK